VKALAIVIALCAVAKADVPNLRLTHEPPPRHLRMRPRTAAVTPAPTPDAPPPPTTTPAPTATDYSVVRDLRRPISVRFNLGYAVDGTNLRSNPVTLNNKTVDPEQYARLRSYALGEGYFSSRGVLAESLSTYFSGHFQIAKPSTVTSPLSEKPVPVGPPIATWFEKSGVEPRAVWAEVKDFLGDRRLAPIRLRAGEVYVYGPWMLHMYGALAGWEGKLLRASVYGGSRVPDYTNAGFFDNKDRAGIAGTSVSFDLRALKVPIPFAIGLESLQFTAAGSDDNNATSHNALQLDWRPRKDIALISRLRILDGRLANEYVQLRTRFRQVTNLVFDYSHRHSRDWRWDPSITSPDPLEAKRYLDLGPVLPQAIVSGRAGTLIKENVDLLVRGAYAWAPPPDADPTLRSTYVPTYFEVGSALEVRLRRTISLGLSALTRQTERTAKVFSEIPDVPGQIDILPAQFSSDLGERGFTELGTTLRLSLGARRLSALVEVFGRRTRYSLVYCDATTTVDCMSPTDTGVINEDTRGGGRFTVDAWVGSQLRLFASYELSTRLAFQPELTGFKSLKLMMEGNY
jgi:hypothetical protein